MTPEELSYVDGTLEDVPDALQHAGRLRTALSSRNLVAAVEEPLEVGDQVRFTVLARGTTAVRTDGGAADAEVLVADLATELDCDVHWGDFWSPGRTTDSEVSPEVSPQVSPEVPEETERRHVVLTRSQWADLPIVASVSGTTLEATSSDGWTVLRPGRNHSDLAFHPWSRRELPVVHLAGVAQQPYVTVLGRPGAIFEGHYLVRSAPRSLTFDPDELPPSLAGVAVSLGEPHRAPDSQLRALLATPGFLHVDLDRVAQALQEPSGPQWVRGVLEALGLPTLAAEVFEQGGELPEAELFEPRSFVSTVLASTRLDLDREDAGPLQRHWALARRRPLVALWTAVPALGLGAAGLWWALTSDPRPWWLTAVGIGAALLVIDGLVDLGLMVTRLRRRKRS